MFYARLRGSQATAAGAESRAGRQMQAKAWRLGGNPYSLFGRRPFREALLRSYILTQHRAGRPLSTILDDSYVRRLGSESFCWRVIQDPRTIEALEGDIREAITRCDPRCRR
jgi:hypothetical protein